MASHLKYQQDLNCECVICGKKYHEKPSQVKRYPTHTCSKECSLEFHRRIMTGKNNHQYGLKGSMNSSWKSDVKITNYGYRKIRSLKHPFKDCDGFVHEHRLVAEQFLLTKENSIEINGQFYLRPEYIVHHKDENRLNNNPNNLEVMLKGKHSSFHNKINPVERDITTGRFISNKGA